jgi:hypothetical protein
MVQWLLLLLLLLLQLSTLGNMRTALAAAPGGLIACRLLANACAHHVPHQSMHGTSWQ